MSSDALMNAGMTRRGAAAAPETGEAAGTAPVAGAEAAATLDVDDVQALTSTAASFADTWHRWSSRQAVAAGANVTRLRLLHLVRCHGPQKMADLADSLDVTPRSVTALVDGLEGEGLVRRTAHATDRRVTLVELACDGNRVANQMTSYRAALATLFTDMPEPDRRTLLRLLTGLRDRMQADAATPGHSHGHRHVEELHHD
jgi:DNA-binding MarR family transcriptional regulator